MENVAKKAHTTVHNKTSVNVNANTLLFAEIPPFVHGFFRLEVSRQNGQFRGSRLRHGKRSDDRNHDLYLLRQLEKRFQIKPEFFKRRHFQIFQIHLVTVLIDYSSLNDATFLALNEQNAYAVDQISVPSNFWEPLRSYGWAICKRRNLLRDRL